MMKNHGMDSRETYFQTDPNDEFLMGSTWFNWFTQVERTKIRISAINHFKLGI
jgi:hypothetical protein